jgi:hypothetical protein
MKVTIKCFVHAEKEPWDLEVKHTIYPFDMTSTSSRSLALIGEQDIEIEVPDGFDIRPSLVANLEREKEKLSREFNGKVMEINREIQSLLAIENKPTSMAEAEEASDIPF